MHEIQAGCVGLGSGASEVYLWVWPKNGSVRTELAWYTSESKRNKLIRWRPSDTFYMIHFHHITYTSYPYEYVEREDEILDNKANFGTVTETKPDFPLFDDGRVTGSTTGLHSTIDSKCIPPFSGHRWSQTITKLLFNYKTNTKLYTSARTHNSG